MTREEAIRRLKWVLSTCENKKTSYATAIDMAILALSAEHKDCTDFLCWLLEEIMDEENWEMNAEADGEIIARKLKKLGLLDSKDGYYIRTPMYEALTEPSDLISRAEAVKRLKEYMGTNCLIGILNVIRDMPSVSAERCGECRKELEDLLKQYAEVASKKKDIVAQHICDGISLCLGSIPAERVGVWIRKEEELNDCDGHRAYYWQECSECGARPPKDQWKNEWHSPYCPNCGARMENKK